MWNNWNLNMHCCISHGIYTIYGWVGFVLEAVYHNAVALSALPTPPTYNFHLLLFVLIFCMAIFFWTMWPALFFSTEQSHFHDKDRLLEIHDLHQMLVLMVARVLIERPQTQWWLSPADWLRNAPRRRSQLVERILQFPSTISHAHLTPPRKAILVWSLA